MICNGFTRSVVASLAIAVIIPSSIKASSAQTTDAAMIAADLGAKAGLPPAEGNRPETAAASQKSGPAGGNDTDRRTATRMSSAERVNIRIQGYAALSGEYRINGDGTLAMPGLGRIEIGDSTIAELETRLASEIVRVSNREASVAIEVVDYRPVFVSGIVTRVGAFPWKPGLRVLHAETLAGGLYRAAGAAESSIVPSTDRERERAVRAAYDLASARTSIARLRAEKENSNSFTVPPRLASLVSKEEQDGIVAAQRAMLDSRSTAFAVRVSALQNTKAMALQEKTALETQMTRIQDQLNKRRAMEKKIERMTDQGYARGDRLFEEQVRISALEERMTTTSLAIAKMEMTAASAQQDLDLLVLGRKADIDTELLGLEQRASQLEIEIDSANGLFKRFTGQDALGARDAEITPSYEVVRVEGGKSKVIPANRSTALQPGDVLLVGLSRKSS